MSDVSLLPIVRDDLPFVREMLYEAAFWRGTTDAPSLQEALHDPALARYVAGWGREGDHGLIARLGPRPVGAAWIRPFAEDDHGYGFVDEQTPELSMAVKKHHRGRGIGRCLLTAIVTQARLLGIAHISLSVENDNPARFLYDDLGFVAQGTAEGSMTMLRPLG